MGDTIHKSWFNIHGQFASLADGYELVKYPPGELIALADGLDNRAEIQISRSTGLLKIATSVVQLIMSCVTIYRTRGSQLERYGYAAFGLSVFPYAFMSLVNLISIAIVGDYPSLYVMRTPLLDEAKGRDGTRISGEVGTLKEAMNDNGCEMMEDRIERTKLTAVRMWKETKNGENILAAQVDEAKLPTKFKLVDDDETAKHEIFVSHIDHYRRTKVPFKSRSILSLIPPAIHSRIPKRIRSRIPPPNPPPIRSCIQIRSAKQIFISLFISASLNLAVILPHLLIFILTGYKKQDSTALERGFMSSWLIINQIYALGFSFSIVERDPTSFIPPDPVTAIAIASISGTFLSVSIGGFVMVGKMLHEFGSCSLIP